MQWNAIRGREVVCGILILLLSANILVYANVNMTQYYYENSQISVINGQSHANFFLVGSDRIESLTPNAMYYVGDGKNCDYFLVHFGLSAKDSLQQSIDYQPYGGAFGVKANIKASFGYNGAYRDPTTKLIYLKARDYQPQIMRFITNDSYHVWNKYSFSNADPINNIDPSGHKAVIKTYIWPLITLGTALAGPIVDFAYTKYLNRSMEDYARKVNTKIDAILNANEGISDAVQARLEHRIGIVSLKEDGIEYNNNKQIKAAIWTHKNNLKTLKQIETVLQYQQGILDVGANNKIHADSFGIVDSFVYNDNHIQELLDISTYRNQFTRGIIRHVLPEISYCLNMNKVYQIPLLNYDDDSLTPESAERQWFSLRRIYARQQGLNPLPNSMYRRQIYAIN